MNSALRFALMVLAGALFLPVSVLAQKYPERPVRVVIVFPPGGSNDVVGRIVFQKVAEITGQQFVIDNRGGAAGQIGSEIVAKSPADGYTVMVQSTTHVANAHLYKKLNYDVIRDFAGVTTLARQVGMLVVHPSLPVKNGQELVALAKKHPGELVYASAGNGSYVHLSMALMAEMAGLRMIHVPYKGGGPAGTALIAGETQAMLATIGSLFPHIKSGRVRPIGVATDKRVSQFPDVPAIAEFVPGYEFTAWVGCFVPAGTPKAVIDTLNGALGKALADPGVASKLSVQTLDPMHMTPEEFTARIKSDYDKYEKVVRVSGARVD
ncbi:MAG: tripartite tricarboxylate transporter substrate binding protein [Burkholderiales bacterium]|nr:tripartite tricarboxylate transporter substrate binding protein [Burkholderiales bacterium]